jgi:hypothetical protein
VASLLSCAYIGGSQHYSCYIGPVGFEALGLGSRRWGWVRDIGFKTLALGSRFSCCARASSNSRWSSSIWSIRTPVVGWSALSAPRLTLCTAEITRHDYAPLCTEEGVRCERDKGGQQGGKGEMNSRRTALVSLYLRFLSLSKNEPAHIPRSVSLSSDLCRCRQIRSVVVELVSCRGCGIRVVVVESVSLSSPCRCRVRVVRFSSLCAIPNRDVVVKLVALRPC